MKLITASSENDMLLEQLNELNVKTQQYQYKIIFLEA